MQHTISLILLFASTAIAEEAPNTISVKFENERRRVQSRTSGRHLPEGRVVLTGDKTEWFTQSYAALLAYDQVSQCCRWEEDGNHPPYGFGKRLLRPSTGCECACSAKG
jgi:hypothetical protein